MTADTLIRTAMRPDLAASFKEAAERWVELDDTARRMEELKSYHLYSWMKDLGDKPVAAAEREVKGSVDWKNLVERTVEARTAANHARVLMETVRAQIVVLQATRLWPQSLGEQLGEETERGE